MEWEPEPDIDAWEESRWEEYNEYKDEHCKCALDEDCTCLTFEQFREKFIDNLEGYWVDDEPEQEGEIYGNV